MPLRIYIFTIISLIFSLKTSAQFFTVPTNGAPNVPVNLTNISGLTDFSNNKFYTNSQNFSVSTNPFVNFSTYTFPSNLLNIPTFSDLAFDGTNYYLFSSNYNGGIIRWDFGTNIMSTPSATNLGNLGNQQNEGIIIRKENNNWHGFVVSNGGTTKITRIDFGTNLANPSPTTTSLGVLSLNWPHELAIIDEGGNWYGFVANRNGKVTRLDFGNSLTNMPTPFIYNSPLVINPCNLRVLKDDGEWYLFSLNLFNGDIVRSDLGTNIANNNPSYTNLGEPHPALGIARGFTILQDCNGLRGIVCDEATNIFNLSFGGDSIQGAISGTPLISTTITNGYVNDFTPFWHNDTLKFFLTLPLSWVGQAQIIPTSFPTAQSSTAYSPSLNYSNGGNYNISNLINIGDNGMRYQCSPIEIDSVTNIYKTKCPGDTIILPNNSVVSTPGTYTDTLLNSANQDSIVITHFSNYPIYNNSNLIFRCQGQSYTLPGNTVVTTSGTYIDTLQSINGCDSIITSAVQFNPTYSIINDDTTCDNVMFNLPGGGMVNTAGVYIDSFTTVNGCDSVITTNLVVNPSYQVNIMDTICQGNSYTLPDNTVVTSSGNYTTVLASSQNCDSSINTNLYVLPFSQSVENISLCDQSSYQLPSGTAVTTSGTYTSTLVSVNGCDSIVTSNISFNNSQFSTEQINICSNSSYTLPDNRTVSTAGNYTSVLTASNGCDSTITTTLSVTNPPTLELGEDFVLCNNEQITLDITTNNATYLWGDNTTNPVKTINSPGVYIVTVTVAPCPSVTDSVEATSCECQVFIPNAFSPNNDTRNDIFRPIINCNIEPGSYIFEVYNRWGQKVFFTTLPNDGWNGRFKRQLQNIGSYFYVVKFTNLLTKEAEQYQGDITLIK